MKSARPATANTGIRTRRSFPEVLALQSCLPSVLQKPVPQLRIHPLGIFEHREMRTVLVGYEPGMRDQPLNFGVAHRGAERITISRDNQRGATDRPRDILSLIHI